MKVTQVKPIFNDTRGSITDIIENQNFDAATIITCQPGAVRGNHYHKDTLQYIYMLSGHILYRTRLPDGRVIDSELKAGDLIVSEEMEAHAMEARELSTFLVLTRGPRQGGNYESDTFRLEQPLIEKT
jgi:quercetin dioxygenase-like cupin family protein